MNTPAKIKVVLHIERLELRGIATGQRDAVVAGLREGLERTLAEPGVAMQLTANGHRGRLRGRMPDACEPAELGREAATVIAGILSARAATLRLKEDAV